MRLVITNIKKYNIRVILLIVGLVFSIWKGNESLALPVYKNIEHGQVDFSETNDPNILQVDLITQMSSLNWSEFDLEPGQEVIFNFLKPGSISINKVLAPAGLSSWIQGNITGTGYGETSYLILSDPNGIQVASTSTITGFQQLTLTNLEPFLNFQDGSLTHVNLEMYSEADYPETSASTIAVLGDITLLTRSSGVDLISTNGSYAGGVVQLGPTFQANIESHIIFAGLVKDVDDYITIGRVGNQMVSREISLNSANNLVFADIVGDAYMDHPLSNDAIAKFPNYDLATLGEILFNPTSQRYYFNVKGFAGPTSGVFFNGQIGSPGGYYSPNLTKAYIFRPQTVNPQGFTVDIIAAAPGIQPVQPRYTLADIGSLSYNIPERVFYAGFDLEFFAPMVKEMFPVVYSLLINNYLQELYPAIPYLTHSDRKSISKSCTYFAPRTLDEAIALSQRRKPVNGNWLAESNELNIDCHTGLNSGPLVLFDANSFLLNNNDKEFFVDEEVFLDEKGRKLNGDVIVNEKVQERYRDRR